MSDESEQLLAKLEKIRENVAEQIVFLRSDTARVDLTELMDQTGELEEIVLNQAHGPEKNYPLLIANFLSDNPLTAKSLKELDQLCGDFAKFLKS